MTETLQVEKPVIEDVLWITTAALLNNSWAHSAVDKCTLRAHQCTHTVSTRQQCTYCGSATSLNVAPQHSLHGTFVAHLLVSKQLCHIGGAPGLLVA